MHKQRVRAAWQHAGRRVVADLNDSTMLGRKLGKLVDLYQKVRG